MSFDCEVCESPTATTLHFGGRSCKACAAFFRRTVSMNMLYECVNGGLTICRIHHELRMLCRQCRFLKCLRAGMNRDLVQARRDDSRLPKMLDEKPTTRRRRYPSSSTTLVASPESSSQPSTSQSPEFPSRIMYAPKVNDIYSQDDRSQLSIYDIDDELPGLAIVDYYVRQEAALNDRRRLMYTEVPMRDVLGCVCKCPYEKKDLRQFDYRQFTGFDRADFIMLYDFARSLKGFEGLTVHEKSIAYRYSCAVDCMINSAYYTYCLGIKENLLILFNGEYIQMDPMPMSGDEEGIQKLFESEQDLVKYKSLMPIKIKQWKYMAQPFSELNLSFEEFVLLKALTIWHICYYKLSSNGRRICTEQRNALLLALHRLCLERGDDPAERMGDIIFSMNYIIEQVNVLTNSYLMITFFDILKCDAKLMDCLDVTY